MEAAFIEAMKQVPALAVLAFILFQWVKFQDRQRDRDVDRDKSFAKMLTHRDEALKSIGDDCHRIQRDSIDAMRSNTEQSGRTEQALERVSTVLTQMGGSP